MAATTGVTVILADQDEALTVEPERSFTGGQHYVYVTSTTHSRANQSLRPAEARAYAAALIAAAEAAEAAQEQEDAQ